MYYLLSLDSSLAKYLLALDLYLNWGAPICFMRETRYDVIHKVLNGSVLGVSLGLLCYFRLLSESRGKETTNLSKGSIQWDRS